MAVAAASVATPSPEADDALSSWREGAAKRAVLRLVRSVVSPGPTFVPPEARIAVFDNDGTLWCEKPTPVELGFILERLAVMATRDSALRKRQPWKAAFEGDHAWLAGAIDKHYRGDDRDVRVLLHGVLAAFAGWSVERYAEAADAFVRTRLHPTLGRPYRECGYRPMVELVEYLAANGFTSYIASGGSRDFMRTFASEVYGIPPERVIGSSSELKYRQDARGGSIVYGATPEVFDDGPAKPVRIWSRVGRRPILACGNSNGDLPMLEITSRVRDASLCLLVHHDDRAREFAYDTGAEKALERARERRWTVVSMANDWARVFDHDSTMDGARAEEEKR